jgi:hypothetical protein
MSGLVWDFQSAARISRAVRKVEQTGQSQFDDLAFMPRLAGARDWVKTPSTLPGGYDGTEPLDGVKVVRLPDGTIHEHPQSVYILDPNGTPLEADKIYPAQFAGTYEDAGITQGLYLVQAGSGSLSANYIGETVVGYYKGGTYTITGGYYGFGYTDVTVYVGPPNAVFSSTQTFRLHHGAQMNKTLWGAPVGNPATMGSTNTFEVPALYTTIDMPVMCKRGELIFGSTYDCFVYSLIPFSFPTWAIFGFPGSNAGIWYVPPFPSSKAFYFGHQTKFTNFVSTQAILFREDNTANPKFAQYRLGGRQPGGGQWFNSWGTEVNVSWSIASGYTVSSINYANFPYSHYISG